MFSTQNKCNHQQLVKEDVIQVCMVSNNETSILRQLDTKAFPAIGKPTSLHTPTSLNHCDNCGKCSPGVPHACILSLSLSFSLIGFAVLVSVRMDTFNLSYVNVTGSPTSLQLISVSVLHNLTLWCGYQQPVGRHITRHLTLPLNVFSHNPLLTKCDFQSD